MERAFKAMDSSGLPAQGGVGDTFGVLLRGLVNPVTPQRWELCSRWSRPGGYEHSYREPRSICVGLVWILSPPVFALKLSSVSSVQVAGEPGRRTEMGRKTVSSIPWTAFICSCPSYNAAGCKTQLPLGPLQVHMLKFPKRHSVLPCQQTNM